MLQRFNVQSIKFQTIENSLLAFQPHASISKDNYLTFLQLYPHLRARSGFSGAVEGLALIIRDRRLVQLADVAEALLRGLVRVLQSQVLPAVGVLPAGTVGLLGRSGGTRTHHPGQRGHL